MSFLRSLSCFGSSFQSSGGCQDDGPTPENATIFQAFEWYVPADQQHWKRLRSALPSLRDIGINSMWIPPACKASSPQGNGYDIYDLYDLGEFDQKGGTSTKWGTKEELIQLVNRSNETGIDIYWDGVLNHKAAADYTEKCQAVEVDPDDRTKKVSKPAELEAWLGFDFPGRHNKHSSQKYHWQHFSGTDYNAATKKMAIYKILGYNDKWSRAVDTSEKGNLDYLMFANLEYGHPEVQQDVKRWGEWLGKEVKIRGMRLDAVRHISADFLTDFIRHLERTVGGANWFFVGEFWKNDVGSLRKYIDRMNHRVSLFDVPLIYNFLSISRTKAADLTKVFDNTLVKAESNHAVTIVMNHDTQPFQTLEAIIAPYFKPLAYALILLRQSGRPCVFYGDLYGIQGEHPFPISCNGKLPDLCLARKLYAYGKQHDYFDSPHCIGWTREGTWDRPSGLACVMSNWRPNQKIMFVGKRHAGEVWTDSLGWHQGRVVIDRMGFGTFPCAGASVSVWIHLTAEGRDKLGSFDSDIYHKHNS